MEINGTPGVAFKAGVEKMRRVLQGRAFCEGHLYDRLVGFSGADQSVVVPHRNASPLPLLDDFGIGFLDQSAQPAEHLAPPVAQFPDSPVNQLRRRLTFLHCAVLHVPCLYQRASCVIWMRLPQVSFNWAIVEPVTAVGGMMSAAPRALMRSHSP